MHACVSSSRVSSIFSIRKNIAVYSVQYNVRSFVTLCTFRNDGMHTDKMKPKIEYHSTLKKKQDG